MTNALGGLLLVGGIILLMYCVIWFAARLALFSIRWADRRDARRRELERLKQEEEVAEMRHASIRAYLDN